METDSPTLLKNEIDSFRNSNLVNIREEDEGKEAKVTQEEGLEANAHNTSKSKDKKL